MIAESVEGETADDSSTGIVARVDGKGDPSVAGRLARTALRRRERRAHRPWDEGALSPATSVILMVAITVGLAILLYFMVLWTTPGH